MEDRTEDEDEGVDRSQEQFYDEQPIAGCSHDAGSEGGSGQSLNNNELIKEFYDEEDEDYNPKEMKSMM